jgi:hypothetical protein
MLIPLKGPAWHFQNNWAELLIEPGRKSVFLHAPPDDFYAKRGEFSASCGFHLEPKFEVNISVDRYESNFFLNFLGAWIHLNWEGRKAKTERVDRFEESYKKFAQEKA